MVLWATWLSSSPFQWGGKWDTERSGDVCWSDHLHGAMVGGGIRPKAAWPRSPCSWPFTTGLTTAAYQQHSHKMSFSFKSTFLLGSQDVWHTVFHLSYQQPYNTVGGIQYPHFTQDKTEAGWLKCFTPMSPQTLSVKSRFPGSQARVVSLNYAHRNTSISASHSVEFLNAKQ